jgi:predicted transcriptional regulator
MPKLRKRKDCYRLMDDSRRPNCRKNTVGQCSLCQQADIRYNVKRQEVLQLRKIKNRQSAMRSRDNQALKWDDLWAENFALQNKKDEVTNTLSAIEREKQQLIAAIYNKGLERAWRTDQIVSNVSKFIVQHPEDAITHLHETFGNLVTHEPDENETVITNFEPDHEF